LDKAGVPLYPGAEVKGTASTGDAAKELHFSALLSTTDSTDTVMQFYKDKLKFEGGTKGAKAQLVGRTAQGADVIIFMEPDGGQTRITVKGILYPKK
jgi:hypothetical protein